MADKTWAGVTGAYDLSTNWSPVNVPIAGDNVRIPAGSVAITSGLNQSAVALADFIVEDGYTAAIASATAYLRIVCSRFIFSGTGVSYVDIGTSAISPQVLKTSGGGSGTRGLYLKGSAISILSVISGKVGLAALFGETSTATTIRCVGSGASVWAGAGLTLTNFYQTNGDSIIRCAGTTLTCHGGKIKTEESGAWTTVDMDAGTFYPNSTGTITTFMCDGGTADFLTSGAARTVTNFKLNPNGTLKYDKNVLTITNWTVPDDPIVLIARRP